MERDKIKHRETDKITNLRKTELVLPQIKTKEATTGLANPPNSTISPMQIDLAPIDKGNKYKKIQPFTRCNLLLLFNYFSNFG